MADSARKKVLDAALKTLLSITETTWWLKAPATFISEVSSRFGDIPDNQYTAFLNATPEELRDALIQLDLATNHAAFTAAGVSRIEGQLKAIQQSLKPRDLVHRQSFGLGVLVGAILEATFVLSYVDPESKMHQDNISDFTKLLLQEGSDLDLEQQTKDLIGSLLGEFNLESLKSFFIESYVDYSKALRARHGRQAELYFDMALALQDLNMALDQARVSLESKQPDLLEIVNGQIENDSRRIRTILSDVDLDSSIKLRLLEIVQEMENVKWRNLEDVYSMSKKLSVILQTVAASI